LKFSFFAVLLLVVLTACQPVDTTLPKASLKENYMKPDNPDPISGDYVKVSPFSIVATDVQQKKQITLNGISHKAKIAYLTVSIAITNQSSQPIMIQPSMFRLVDNKGKVYQPDVKLDLLLNNKGMGFFHHPLKPLERKNVMLVFDTSVNVGQGYLEISGDPHMIKKAYIRLLR
jgi:hypothetical protein